ncbi:MAG: arsenate reductase ArsC [Desulfovermiculus sp.]|nr:arsenate reductase ArsC [Desulfovermiculus sp.]MDZ7761438.1 arsenate reductase ArsC [Desulfovermiculus sp.]
MYKVLIICTHNSARSQMAEAYLQQIGGNNFQVESAGFEPRPINPDVIKVLLEDGIDISSKSSQKVFDLFRQGRIFDFVITICEQEENRCPIFPGLTHRLHLPFPDPSQVSGEEEPRLNKIRNIRDGIKEKMHEFKSWVESEEPPPLSQQWVHK